MNNIKQHVNEPKSVKTLPQTTIDDMQQKIAVKHGLAYPPRSDFVYYSGAIKPGSVVKCVGG
jgi:hypothetical protein